MTSTPACPVPTTEKGYRYEWTSGLFSWTDRCYAKSEEAVTFSISPASLSICNVPTFLRRRSAWCERQVPEASCRPPPCPSSAASLYSHKSVVCSRLQSQGSLRGHRLFYFSGSGFSLWALTPSATRTRNNSLGRTIFQITHTEVFRSVGYANKC